MRPELEANYTCPACGFIVFVEPVGSYAICPVCNWEDDAVQLDNPTVSIGANHMSLRDYQRRVLERLPIELHAYGDFRRDLTWLPLSDVDGDGMPNDINNGFDYFQAIQEGRAVYYWQCGL